VLTVLAAGAALFAMQAREQAESAAVAATESERLAINRSINLLTEQGRRELLDGRPLKALVYLREAYEQGGDGSALRSLLASAARPADAIETVLRERGPGLYWTAFTAKGDRLLAADIDGGIELWRTADHASVGRFKIGERRAMRLRLVDDDTLMFLRKGDVHFVDFAGRVKRVIHAHEKSVMAVALDGAGRAVTGSLETTAKVFDAVGKLQTELVGHQSGIMAVAWSPDGQRAATGSRDKTARIWDSTSGEPLHTLEGHAHGVSHIVFSPAGDRLLTVSRHEAWLWDVGSGERLQTYEGHNSALNAARFFRRGVLTAGHDNTARVWSIDGKSLLKFGGHDDFARGGAFTPSAINDVVVSPDGAAFITRGSDATVRIWDVTTGGRLETLMGHLEHVNDIAVHPATGQVVTAGNEGKLILWRPTYGALRNVVGNEENAVRAADLNEGGIVVAYDDGRVQLATDGAPMSIEGLTPTYVSRRGARVLLADAKGGKAALLDGEGKLLQLLEGHAGGTHHGDLQPAGELVATAGDDGAKLWREGELVHLLKHDQSVRFVRFSPDGSSLLAIERGGAKLWNVADGAARFDIPPPKAAAARWPEALFDPSGSRILLMTSPLKLRVYDSRDGKEILALEGGRGAFSSDGAKLIVAATSPVVRIYDRSGHQTATLDGHTEPIVELGFMEDGRAVTASRDGSVRIWDATTGKVLEILQAHRNAVMGAWIDPKAARILTLGDGRAKLWSAAPETRPVSAITALCARVAPWELVDGHLVERELAAPTH